MAEFVHLHLHSEYSLLDGACRIADIPARAAEAGHTAVALTDHGVMYGTVAFYRACRAAGIKPILGCEVYVAPRSRFEKTNTVGEANYAHLVLLCENEIGYRNLMYMVSKSFTEGFYSRPRVDMELLRAHHEGLIALSACLSGFIPRALMRGEYAVAKQHAEEMAAIFGEGHYYIELQDHGLADQRAILPQLAALARECGLPMVATNDVHYLRKNDAHTQAVLMCIQTNRTLDEGKPVGFETNEFYYKTTEEMEALFADYEGAIANTAEIAARCQVELDFDSLYQPEFTPPGGLTPAEHLRALTEEGFERRKAAGQLSFTADHPEQEYRDRVAYELSVIEQMGYADYFLIVQDYVGFAKRSGIPVGPGRGSGAGSLVAYLLGITDVDSIRHDLLFERFLNPERVSMPDIDIDFCYDRRDEVIDYVIDRYGRDHVAQIVTFGTLAARAAVRDVGRVLGMSVPAVDAVANAIPRDLGITLAEAMKTPALQAQMEASAQVRTLLDLASAIEGMPRNISVHAAGVVITRRPLWEYVPLAKSNDTLVTQYDMDTIASLGLIKFDFLALRYLTILSEAENQVRESEPDFALDRLPTDDAKTYALISRGDTGGVFQLESGGMRQMLTSLKPAGLDDILAAIALYRPGPMESIPLYIARRHDPTKIVYSIPQLEPILRDTYGCIVYQEQVMRIFRELAGYTFGHADIVRRAMSKKKASVMAAERESFLAGTAERGIAPEAADALFAEMESFANYAFNKSHAAAYAMISYRTAYLKAHHPRAYFAALLTSVLGNAVKVSEYIAECGKRGIAVLPPDINESRMTFHVCEGGIRFGLLAIKNVGRQFIEAILRERKKRPFASFDDFVERMAGGELNRRQIEALIKTGCFDRLGIDRGRLLAAYGQILDSVSARSRSNLVGQLDLFSAIPDASAAPGGFVYPERPDLTLREKLMMEKECAGMYFSGHLLDSYARHIEDLSPVPLYSILEAYGEEGSEEDRVRYADKKTVTVVGMITDCSMKKTKRGEQMLFFRLEDRLGEMEVLAFPRQYQTYAELLHADSAVCLRASLSVRPDETPKLLLNEAIGLLENDRYQPAPPAEASAKPAQPSPSAQPHREQTKRNRRLYLRVPDTTSLAYRKAVNLVKIFDGSVETVAYDNSTGTYSSIGGVALSDRIMAEFIALLGEENVKYQ
ncbi:MAG: DNA polymerase III subunit alpha [Ruminococcaceae bacterium]|nr:DNA polymerase III subunit alpha [Oscillospiraceae bacterium]